MFDLNLTIILSLAFGMGMLHALDADHIAMVTGLSGRHAGFHKSVVYCTRWAIGHALTLIVIGTLVFIIGLQLPEQLSLYAEFVIAVFLIGLGIVLLYRLHIQRIHIHFHEHDDLPKHAHWHSHESGRGHQHQHRALLIGSLHGLAGSAPLLALIPLAVNQQPVIGMSYLLLFSLGVIVAMLVFGGLLSAVTNYLYQTKTRLLNWFRFAVGLATITVGGLLMLRVVQ